MMKGDQKMKSRIHKSIENEGMGVGFLDFLDTISSKVKQTDINDYKQTEYDFNDDAKEVLLDEADIME